jgi:hypothetical protein
MEEGRYIWKTYTLELVAWRGRNGGEQTVTNFRRGIPHRQCFLYGNMEEGDDTTTWPWRGEAEDKAGDEHVPATEGLTSEGTPPVLLQVNCRSICKKILEFWNLNDTYNPDVVIGTESWISEEINNPEIFRDDYKIFRRDRYSRDG